MMKFYSLEIVKMQIVVIVKLDCNGLSFNSVHNVKVNNCFTSNYCIRIDEKRFLKMFPQKSTNHDISLKACALGSSVTRWIEIVPMVVMNVPFGGHSQSHQSGNDDDKNDESDMQIAFVFILAACA